MSDDSPSKSFRLEGRRVLVTGAAGHLGEPIARSIAEAGGAVVLAGRTVASLDVLAASIRATGAACETLLLDVASPDSCRRAIDSLARVDDRLAGIVNGAYSGRGATVETSTELDFDAACRQNLTGPFALIQAALPLLKKSAADLAGGAAIVNIASMYGHVSPDPRIYGNTGRNNPPFYGAAKAGLVQLTRYLAVHLGPDRIRVNSVSPGPFPPASIATTDPAFHAALCHKVPLGRVGDAFELSGPVVFLLSAAASFVTGADLAVDGGWTAQ